MLRVEVDGKVFFIPNKNDVEELNNLWRIFKIFYLKTKKYVEGYDWTKRKKVFMRLKRRNIKNNPFYPRKQFEDFCRRIKDEKLREAFKYFAMKKIKRMESYFII